MKEILSKGSYYYALEVTNESDTEFRMSRENLRFWINHSQQIPGERKHASSMCVDLAPKQITQLINILQNHLYQTAERRSGKERRHG